jgi:hypothetical protein
MAISSVGALARSLTPGRPLSVTLTIKYLEETLFAENLEKYYDINYRTSINQCGGERAEEVGEPGGRVEIQKIFQKIEGEANQEAAETKRKLFGTNELGVKSRT